MTLNLPIELLRSFVAVVEQGSITRATERIFLSQSALSLQIKRLEEILQRPLFERDGKKLVINAAGTELLAHAREILAANDRAVAALIDGGARQALRFGVVQDFADSTLPSILKRFSAEHPGVRLDIRMTGSTELIRAYRDRQLDIVLCLSLHDDDHAIARGGVHWIGAPELAEQAELPLVLLPEPYAYRTLALQALERDRRRYRIVVESPNVDGLRAALEAGLGVTARTLDFLPPSLAARMDIARGLPTLPDIRYVLYHGDGAAADLARIVRDTFQAPPAARQTSRHDSRSVA